MNKLQKTGGFAALYMALAYLVGMAGFLLVVNVSGETVPVKQVALMAENQVFLHIMHMAIYVIWAFFLVVLALALYERLKDGSPAIAQTATVFGMIWATVIISSGMIYIVGMESVVNLYDKDPAQAATIWVAIDSIAQGLGGSNEILGGIWTLLLSWAALKSGMLPRVLNYLGIVIGVAGLASIVPATAELFIFIYAFAQIAWFIWIGIVLLRNRKIEN
jgi:hypothetical protein